MRRFHLPSDMNWGSPTISCDFRWGSSRSEICRRIYMRYALPGRRQGFALLLSCLAVLTLSALASAADQGKRVARVHMSAMGTHAHQLAVQANQVYYLTHPWERTTKRANPGTLKP